jgi:hypothetical protein
MFFEHLEWKEGNGDDDRNGSLNFNDVTYIIINDVPLINSRLS